MSFCVYLIGDCKKKLCSDRHVLSFKKKKKKVEGSQKIYIYNTLDIDFLTFHITSCNQRKCEEVKMDGIMLL